MRVTLGSLRRIYRTFSPMLALSTLVNHDFQGHLQPCKDEGIKIKLLLLGCLGWLSPWCAGEKTHSFQVATRVQRKFCPLSSDFLCQIYLGKKNSKVALPWIPVMSEKISKNSACPCGQKDELFYVCEIHYRTQIFTLSKKPNCTRNFFVLFFNRHLRKCFYWF